MLNLLPFIRRYGLLLFPLTVIGFAIDAQIFIYQRFSEFHIPDSWIFHLLYFSFGPFMFFHKSETMRFRHTLSVSKRVFWALYIGLITFYALAFIGVALHWDFSLRHSPTVGTALGSSLEKFMSALGAGLNEFCKDDYLSSYALTLSYLII